MRLKSLRLAGFKSFANPTNFNFSKNITAIVGPNGCGKSNVIDAIRWVLGETSAKQLRGGAMSDVIFAGTQEKSAKSLASVELTFEHTQDEQTGIRHELNLYHELSVRRQVNKDGKSDYFINGTRCRRRDVVDIFLGTGLGSRSYAVIEQGMIGRIVDSNPMQLREFIEEGAGISRYQARRLETQKKLTQAKENLDRLNDLKIELEKQQKTLSKQAETAKKYQELTDKLHTLEQDIAIHQLYSAKYAEQKQKQAHKLLEETVNENQNTINSDSLKLDKLSSRVSEQQWLKDDARDKHHNEQLKLQQLEHSLSQHQANIQPLIEKQQHLTEQSTENQKQLSTLTQQLAREEQQLNLLVPQLSDLKGQKADMHSQLEPFITQSQQLKVKRDELEGSQREIEKEHALAQQATQRLEIEQQRWTEKQKTWQQAHEQFSENPDFNDIEIQITAVKQRLNSILQRHDDASVSLDEEQHSFNQLKAEIQQAQLNLQIIEKQQTTLNSEYNTLHTLVYPPKQKILNQTTNGQTNAEHTIETDNVMQKLQIMQKLSDKIELSSEGQVHADLLDMWLAMWLDSTLIEAMTDDSKSWLNILNHDLNTSNPAKKDTVTQAVNVLLNTQKTAINSSFDCNQIANLTPLIKLIKTPKISLLANGYLYCIDTNQQITNIEANLRELLTNMPEASYIITNTGWLAGNFGCIHLNKLTNEAGDSHFLRQREAQRTRLGQLENELDIIDSDVDNKQQALKKLQARHDEQQITIEELSAQVSNLTSASHEHKQQLIEMNANFIRQQADNKRLTDEKKLLDAEKVRFKKEHNELSEKLVVLDMQLPMLTSELNQINDELETSFKQRTNIESQSRHLDTSLQAMTMQEQKLALSVQHVQNQINQLTKQLSSYDDEHNKIATKIENLEKQLPSLKKSLKEQKNVCHEYQIKLEEYQSQLEELQNQLSKERENYNEIQIKFAKEQQQLAEVTTKLAIAKEKLNDACNRIDGLAQLHTPQYQQEASDTENPEIDTTSSLAKNTHVANEQINNLQAVNQITSNTLKVSSSSLLTDFILHKGYDKFDEVAAASKQKQRQQDYQALQMQIGSIGAVNLVAVAELEQVNERLEPLTTQTDDILASVKKLTDAITTIDTKTKELFLQTLESVNRDLVHLFSKVFGGGQASLTLISDDKLDKKDKWRAGLELMAQPKGKKNSRLAVLSGGEKTLTALSLIFAIFKQHPAPFCVLDEVDAPLDDANVGRFTSLIEELATDLQFIFISHNKLSMQIADELKGITMPNAGISSLVSVSLDEAEQYIDSSA